MLPHSDHGLKYTKIELEDTLCFGGILSCGVLIGFIQRMWTEYKIDKIVTQKNEIILVKFDSAETRDVVLQRVKPWYEGNQKEKFSELDLRYRSLIALSKLASILGIPIVVGKDTGEKNMVHYARVLVEMPILEKLPKHIHFEDETRIIQQQDIVFEWHPIQCAKCKNYSHEADNCKKQDRIMVGNTRTNTPTSHNNYTFKTFINNSLKALTRGRMQQRTSYTSHDKVEPKDSGQQNEANHTKIVKATKTPQATE
ncbi:hypothetical protein Cgig2_017427 [Carnegiea gigantea]|uniref:DUF4283 domain-containing protein n=1 Tax=Carnegiea gigantea TaxID=171969 RepID=A0A9Q1Q8C5_9CARY|nr:hypothetical protein Cgig2_017427 [Carnegiea gigantea]